MKLVDALAPLSLESFLRDYVGRQYVVVKGSGQRFKALATWSELNEALTRLRVHGNRVSLVKNAKALPKQTYVRTSASGNVEYLNGAELNRQINDGASLVINQIDELLPEIRTFAESCEDVFRNYVGANLYAGWRTANAFDVHWDEHDTFIVQVIGRKRWTVWRPTLENPLKHDASNTAATADSLGDPIWADKLEQGSILYMPRGWWHVAYPLNEPSVHITFALSHKTGVDVLAWLVKKFQELPAIRTDVPLWGDLEERQRWFTNFRTTCIEAWTDVLAKDFEADHEGHAHTRPIVRLPERLSQGEDPLSDHAPLRLVNGRRLNFTRSAGSPMASFVSAGRQWQCPSSLVPALEMLNHVEPCTLDAMNSRVERSARFLLRPFVLTMLRANTVWTEPELQTCEEKIV